MLKKAGQGGVLEVPPAPKTSDSLISGSPGLLWPPLQRVAALTLCHSFYSLTFGTWQLCVCLGDLHSDLTRQLAEGPPSRALLAVPFVGKDRPIDAHPRPHCSALLRFAPLCHYLPLFALCDLGLDGLAHAALRTNQASMRSSPTQTYRGRDVRWSPLE